MDGSSILPDGIFSNEDLDADIRKLFLSRGMWLMGDMLDYSVNTLGYDLSEFFHYFIDTGIAHNMEIWNPVYIIGLTRFLLFCKR